MKGFFTLAVTALAIASCNKNDNVYGDNSHNPPGQSLVIKATGDSAAVAGAVNQFRAILGDPLNTTPGQTTGRREVNWDGVPPQFTNNNNFPLNFFNITDPLGANGRKRGLIYVDNGSPIRIDSSDFVDLDRSYDNQFNAFSKKKSFISANSNVTEITFRVAGTDTIASVSGFGLIFSDVDDANSTYVEFFNDNRSLGVFRAPNTSGSGSFTFLGVKFKNKDVTRIKITAGNGVLGAGVKDVTDGGSKDLVTMDDFFYDEPKAVN